MNRTRDYIALEQEYISGRMSIRELCRSHDISTPSSVHEVARRRKWAEKREQYQKVVAEKSIEKLAEQSADEVVRVRAKAMRSIEEAIDKFRSDLARGEVSVSARDLGYLIDRMNVMFGSPSSINEERNLGINFSADGLPPEFLAELVRVGRDVDPGPETGAALPRLSRSRTN